MGIDRACRTQIPVASYFRRRHLLCTRSAGVAADYRSVALRNRIFQFFHVAYSDDRIIDNADESPFNVRECTFTVDNKNVKITD